MPANNSCTAHIAVDQPCTIADLEFEQCAPGNVCSLAGGNPTCQPAKTVGETCTKNNFECLR